MDRIIHGDCMEVMTTLPDKIIDLIILDPPYLTTSEKWDKKEIVNKGLAEHLFRVAKDNCSLYVWCGIGEKSQSLIRWFPIFNEEWHFKDLITWKKQRGIGMRKGWLYTREELMWFVKDNNKFVWNIEKQYSEEKRKSNNFGYKTSQGKSVNNYIKSEYKRLSNVWADIPEVTFNTSKYNITKLHFTPKPIKAVERIIKLHTKENNFILDPFAGSGTTAIACINTKRNYILIEKEKEYIDIINKRISEHEQQLSFGG